MLYNALQELKPQSDLFIIASSYCILLDQSWPSLPSRNFALTTIQLLMTATGPRPVPPGTVEWSRRRDRRTREISYYYFFVNSCNVYVYAIFLYFRILFLLSTPSLCLRRGRSQSPTRADVRSTLASILSNRKHLLQRSKFQSYFLSVIVCVFHFSLDFSLNL